MYVITKPMLNDLWNNIDSIVDNKKLNYLNLNPIEKAILNCDLDLIIAQFKKGNNIYYNNILCNGYYKLKYGVHPLNCHNFVCFRTFVYYGLWSNCNLYSKIFIQMLELSSHMEIIEKIEITNIIPNVINICKVAKTIDCCDVVSKYSNFYDHTTTNYKIVYECLELYMPTIVSELEKHYGIDTIDIIDTIDNINTIEDIEQINIIACHRKELGKTYEKLTKISTILGKLKLYWSHYKTSHQIMKLLFSQQANEYFKYNLSNKPYQLDKILDEIVTNPYVDINYVFAGENIFSMTVSQSAKLNMISKVKSLGGVFPESYSIFDIITKCAIIVTKEVIKEVDIIFLGKIRELILFVLSYSNMMSTDKIEIFEILINRSILENNANNVNNVDNIDDLIKLCLSDNKSLGLLEKLTFSNKLISKCNIADVLLAIKLMKHKELDIILEHNPKLINEKYDGYTPIIHFFNETKLDGIEEIMLLKVILKHKPNLEVFNLKGDSPILHTVKCNRNASFNLLFKSGGNVFVYDVDGYNCLHHSIKNNNVDILNILKKCKIENNYLINYLTNRVTEQNSQLHPIILSINSKNPIYLTQLLLAEDCMDYDYTYMENGVLYYLIQCDIPLNTKTTLFKNCSGKNFNLLEECKIDRKPLVVKAVENDLYEIVLIIINKLLEKEEIKFNGYDNLKDVRKLLSENKYPDVIVKNQNSPNFYSLVMMYLKAKFKENFSSGEMSITALFIILCVVLVCCCINLNPQYNSQYDHP